jgi:hypothetical protein
LIVDTSALLAWFNSDDDAHGSVAVALEAATDELVISPFVLAELDYLVATRFGVRAELAVLHEIAGGAWTLPELTTDDVAAAASVVERYADQEIGVADASLVVLARRFRTRTIATLDRRHFTVLRPLDGGRFRIVP